MSSDFFFLSTAASKSQEYVGMCVSSLTSRRIYKCPCHWWRWPRCRPGSVAQVWRCLGPGLEGKLEPGSPWGAAGRLRWPPCFLLNLSSMWVLRGPPGEAPPCVSGTWVLLSHVWWLEKAAYRPPPCSRQRLYRLKAEWRCWLESPHLVSCVVEATSASRTLRLTLCHCSQAALSPAPSWAPSSSSASWHAFHSSVQMERQACWEGRGLRGAQRTVWLHSQQHSPPLSPSCWVRALWTVWSQALDSSLSPVWTFPLSQLVPTSSLCSLQTRQTSPSYILFGTAQAFFQETAGH